MLSGLLQEIVAALDDRQIPYMLSGSLAMSAYTIPRMTRDIDIVIDLDIHDIEKFLEIFSRNFYFHRPSIVEETTRMGMFNVIDHRSGYKIDFVVKKNNAYRKLEFQRRKRSQVFGFETWLVSPEDLILSKLIWIQQLQSEKQMEDIINLLENKTLDIIYIRKWIKELNLETFNLIWMQDTSSEIRQKQFEIIFSKTEEERFLMGLEMMEDMRKMVIRSISLENPGISEVDRKIEFLKRYYKHDFTPGQLASIIEWFKNKQ